jgi:predicted HicB family RNase H-like nuclease
LAAELLGLKGDLPEGHAAISTAAEVSGKSINQCATEAFAKAVKA